MLNLLHFFGLCSTFLEDDFNFIFLFLLKFFLLQSFLINLIALYYNIIVSALGLSLRLSCFSFVLPILTCSMTPRLCPLKMMMQEGGNRLPCSCASRCVSGEASSPGWGFWALLAQERRALLHTGRTEPGCWSLDPTEWGGFYSVARKSTS